MLVRSVIYRKNGWGFNFIRPFQKKTDHHPMVCFLLIAEPVTSSLVVALCAQQWVRIPLPKIDKLACQVQRVGIFAMGEYPGFTPRFEGVLFHYNYLKRFIAFQNPA